MPNSSNIKQAKIGLTASAGAHELRFGFGSHPFREAAGSGEGVENRKANAVDAETMADALAVLMVDLASALPGVDRREVLERLANRLDDRGRKRDGTDAARLLHSVGGALIRMGC